MGSSESERRPSLDAVASGQANVQSAVLRAEGDDAIFVSGDMTKSGLDERNLRRELTGITAIRSKSWRRPPSRPVRAIFYEGSPGDLFLRRIHGLGHGQKVR